MYLQKYDSPIGNCGEAARMNVKEVFTKPVHSPSRVQKKIYMARRAIAEFDVVEWDGDKKCLLIFFILFGSIDNVYIATYIHIQKLSTPLLSV